MSRIDDPQGREMAALCRLVDLAGQDVLDVGCGDGRVTLLMSELAASVVGVDSDREAVARASRQAIAAGRSSVSFVAQDVNTIAAAWRQSFDVVVFSRSL